MSGLCSLFNLSLAVLLLYRQCTEGYQWKDGKYALTKTIDVSSCPKITNLNIDGCVFAVDFCTKLSLAGNSKCGNQDYDQESRHKYKSPRWSASKDSTERDIRVYSAVHSTAEREYYELKCWSNKSFSERRVTGGYYHPESSGYRYDNICDNSYLNGNPRYGLQKVSNDYVFITGPDSPYGYHEGVHHRMFQMDIPERVDWITVWPYRNNLFKGAVTKVQFQKDNGVPISSMVHEWDANRNYFKLHIMRDPTCGSRGGTVRANVLQVAKGEHVSRYNNSRLEATVVETLWLHGVARIPFNRFSMTPLMLVQAMNPHSWNSKFLKVKVENVPSQKRKDVFLTYYPKNGPYDYVRGYVGAILLQLSNENNSELFGPYTQVMIGRRVDYYHKILPFQDPFPSTMVFAEAENTVKVASIKHSSSTEFTATTQKMCGISDHTGYSSKDYLAINFVNSYDKERIAVKENLEYEHVKSRFVNYGCPYISSQGACAGFYKLLPNTGNGVWVKQGNANQFIEFVDGQMKCFRNGKHIESDRSTCVFSDSYCRYLSFIKRKSVEQFAMYGDHVWGWGGGSQIKFSHRDSSGNLVVNNYDTIGDKSYVCENDIIPRGPVYGLNRINGDNVYVVGEKDMVEGLYFRVFKVDAPADGSPITVYPMGFEWGNRITAIKLTVQNTGDSIVPRLVHSGQATFRMELWYPSCVDKSTKKGTVRVNVLQVRTGRFFDPWGVDEIAANSYYARLHVTLTYAFWNSAKGQAEEHMFQGVPVLFTQIFDYKENNAHYYQSIAVSNVTAKSFDARLQGNQGETLEHGAHFHWIGICAKRPNVINSSLFGTSDYLYGTGEVGDDYRADVNYDSLDAKIEPMVFIEGTDPTVDVTRNFYTNRVTTSGMEAVTGMDACSTLKAPPRSFNWLAISKWVTPKKKLYHHSVHNCLGGACRFEQNFCEKVVSFGDAWNSGVYEPIGNFEYRRVISVKNNKDLWTEYNHGSDAASSKDFIIRLNAVGLKDYEAVMVSGDRKNVMSKLNPRMVQCLKGADYGKLGRMRRYGHNAYNVGSDLIEGPFTIDRNVGSMPRKLFVYFKYFQMELTKADLTGKGLYTYVGGEDFGDFNTFGTVFSPFGSASIALAFERVDGRSFYVKPMFACGSTERFKVNVFMLRNGEHRSRDNHLSLTSVLTTVNKIGANDKYTGFTSKFKHKEGHNTAAIITNLQQSIPDGSYVETTGSYETTSSYWRGIAVSARGYKNARTITSMRVAVLLVNMSSTVWKGMYTWNFEENKVVSKYTGRVHSTNISTFEYHTGYSGYFDGAPFMIAAARQVPDSDPGLVQLDDVSGSVAKAHLSGACEGEGKLHADFNFFVIGHFTPL